MELALPQRPDGSSHAVGFGVVIAVPVATATLLYAYDDLLGN